VNIEKYKAWGKKVYRRDINRVVEVYRWMGPRGTRGTDKALARLAWDRKRASSVTPVILPPAPRLARLAASVAQAVRACWR